LFTWVPHHGIALHLGYTTVHIFVIRILFTGCLLLHFCLTRAAVSFYRSRITSTCDYFCRTTGALPAVYRALILYCANLHYSPFYTWCLRIHLPEFTLRTYHLTASSSRWDAPFRSCRLGLHFTVGATVFLFPYRSFLPYHLVLLTYRYNHHSMVRFPTTGGIRPPSFTNTHFIS